jgi:DUF438 domain-containing protein
MENEKMLTLLFDNWNKPIVVVDTDHIIKFMNLAAKDHYSKWGNVIGKNIFHCHNENSYKVIEDAFIRLQKGEEEVLLVNSTKHRVYMRGMRDENKNLVGYFERYEPPVGK